MRTITRFVALLLCLALPAYAAPRPDAIANMKAWCDCVMVGGVCSVSNDQRLLKPGQKVFTSSGPIDAAIYDAYRKDPRMCEKGAQACTESWDGEACRTGFRLMFRQEPMVCLRPGEPRAK